jgi:hypothetical protein
MILNRQPSLNFNHTIVIPKLKCFLMIRITDANIIALLTLFSAFDNSLATYFTI